MNRKITSLIVFIMLLINTPTYPLAIELPETIKEEELINLLNEQILSVIGSDWFRGNEKILEVKQDDGGTVVVKVQVVSFEGPHNPPYLQEIITFKVKGHKVVPIDYFNRVIPENEWDKFKISEAMND
ncbi:DUF3888 domain-containing protein (plasmid) [Niallia taxi]|uniref:DUF3888 domain-containing protein n=1 Tax=Bacilli TaxID=91061 RepID=UPI0015F4C659|nr:MULTISPECIES: DUF3888 domain-containing protein [Bacilli]MCM3032919.1 DUF3888 domain-containing protein [Niallia sp. MER 6]MDK8746865.1 DUF3888 domain-containing protein [Streptococcus agalactiae]MED4057182.1 DUF3888 domain-containing protein [Niallia taxi]MED4122130.1 DUF3888 domain-containing protein [Niallia taxi]